MITLNENLIDQLCNAGYYRDLIVDSKIVDVLLSNLNENKDDAGEAK